MTSTTVTGTTGTADLVRGYLETVWNQGRTELAERYVAADLIQHNPRLPDGLAALTGLVEAVRTTFPQLRFEPRRIAAEGDLVFVHAHVVPAPGERGLAVVDVFRLEGGLIVEHWDVNEEVPATTASGRPIV
ncbi:ester cyclase [Kitasatospora nipponensis]|uniref:Ester cyclase n=1 Tax=Kitasatospora nipponensis TaxID=258049 RepID=A0ABN1VPK3_9ACTN